MSAIEFDFPNANSQVECKQPPVRDHRRAERSSAALKAIVQGQNDSGRWKEVTTVGTVSKNGVGITLTRPCAVGRLVNLVLPMPLEYRVYDKNNDLYQCLGIILHCNKATVDGTTIYHVGIGLIGKEVPDSYKEDPLQNYRITGMQSDGLWDISETASEFKKRKKPRYWLALPVTISLIQREVKSIAKQETCTQNISAGGVSVSCTLDAKVGDKVKFACKPVGFYAIAIVRNRKQVDETNSTLHLEFESEQFPMEKIAHLQKMAA